MSLSGLCCMREALTLVRQGECDLRLQIASCTSTTGKA